MNYKEGQYYQITYLTAPISFIGRFYKSFDRIFRFTNIDDGLDYYIFKKDINVRYTIEELTEIDKILYNLDNKIIEDNK